MEKINNLIDELKEIIKNKKLKVKDDTILENAIKLYLSEVIQENKISNIKSIKDNKNFEPMTDKQKFFLKESGYTGNLNLSKQEAFQLISDYKKNQREI